MQSFTHIHTHTHYIVIIRCSLLYIQSLIRTGGATFVFAYCLVMIMPKRIAHSFYLFIFHKKFYKNKVQNNTADHKNHAMLKSQKNSNSNASQFFHREKYLQLR